MPEEKDAQTPLPPHTSPTAPPLPETSPLFPETACERREVPANKVRGVHDTLDGNPDNPLEWPARFKWGIVALLASMGFMVTFTCMSVVPVANAIVEDLDGHNDSFASVLPVTIWEVGEALGPLLTAPLSEVYGRYPLMNGANVLFIAGAALSATAPSMPVFIASRALTGMAVASNVLNPAIVGDIFMPERRGMAMSLIGFSPLFGGTIGPAFSGFLAQRFGWRSVMWACAALASCCELVFFSYFRETYSVVIMRRAAAKRREEQSVGYGTTVVGTAEVPDADGIDVVVGSHSAGVAGSIARPAAVLFSSGVLAAVSAFSAWGFSHFYILSTTLPGILEDLYGLSQAQTGSAFLANGVGSLIGISICKTWLDRIYIKLQNSNNGLGLPEHRLPLAIAAGFVIPVALGLYGWCAQYMMPLPMLMSAVILIRICNIMINLPLMAYVVDACGLYSASALTGVIVTRCIAGAFLPVAVADLARALGYGWCFAVLGGISLVHVIIPLLLFRYGSQWRAFCKYTQG